MQTNAWLIVYYLLCKFLGSQEWIDVRHEMFGSFGHTTNSYKDLLNKEVLCTSILGVYSLICHLSNYWNPSPLPPPASSPPEKKEDTDEKERREFLSSTRTRGSKTSLLLSPPPSSSSPKPKTKRESTPSPSYGSKKQPAIASKSHRRSHSMSELDLPVANEKSSDDDDEPSPKAHLPKGDSGDPHFSPWILVFSEPKDLPCTLQAFSPL